MDTHLDVHISAAALDPVGGLLGTEGFTADPAGYKAMLLWLEGFGEVAKVGMEGTGSYGASLARFLRHQGIEVVKMERQEPARLVSDTAGPTYPSMPWRRLGPPLAGRSGQPKSMDGAVEAVRVLVIAKRSARQARSKALTQMRHLSYTAPDELRCRLKGLTIPALVAEAASFRPARSADPVTAGTKASISSLAHRVRFLDTEIAGLESHRAPPLRHHARAAGAERRRTRYRCLPPHHGRRQSRATALGGVMAHLCGVSPIQASSGKVTRHRLNRGGDHQAKARCGASLWCASPTTRTRRPTLSAE